MCAAQGAGWGGNGSPVCASRAGWGIPPLSAMYCAIRPFGGGLYPLDRSGDFSMSPSGIVGKTTVIILVRCMKVSCFSLSCVSTTRLLKTLIYYSNSPGTPPFMKGGKSLASIRVFLSAIKASGERCGGGKLPGPMGPGRPPIPRISWGRFGGRPGLKKKG